MLDIRVSAHLIFYSLQPDAVGPYRRLLAFLSYHQLTLFVFNGLHNYTDLPHSLNICVKLQAINPPFAFSMVRSTHYTNFFVMTSDITSKISPNAI
jgi:hypothetical protein